MRNLSTDKPSTQLEPCLPAFSELLCRIRRGAVAAQHGPQRSVLTAGLWCRHIVSSQVYGAKKQSKKPADQWLAMSVDFLMHRYPALRIAYIDMVKSLDDGGKGVPMSVLLRSDRDDAAAVVDSGTATASADDGADGPGIVEVYRVRLPDQVEDGRGVVRLLPSVAAGLCMEAQALAPAAVRLSRMRSAFWCPSMAAWDVVS